MTVFVGLDIGGTKIMVAAADREGNILRRARADTSTSLETDLANINRMIAEVAAEEEIIGMGAAIGGPLDWEQGIVSPLHQPAWRNVPLKAMMESKWGCAFRVDVDTNVAAVGEYRWGGILAKRFLYLTLSTGMGGGFLVDGQIYRGQDGAHPEVGHQSINFRSSNLRAVQCECGAPDCLEALVSGNGIRRIYGKPAEALTSQEWDEVAYNLGQGIAQHGRSLCPGSHPYRRRRGSGRRRKFRPRSQNCDGRTPETGAGSSGGIELLGIRHRLARRHSNGTAWAGNLNGFRAKTPIFSFVET